MPVQFSTILIADLLVSIPIILYYYKYGVMQRQRKGAMRSEFQIHVRNAYALTGFAVAIIPSLLVYYLWDNLLKLYPAIFMQTAIVMLILILIFEYVNYYSYIHYESGVF